MKEQFVIKSENGKYIGVDGSSSGYPWETDNIFHAKIWGSKKEAWKYKQIFKKETWTLHMVLINNIPVRWEI